MTAFPLRDYQEAAVQAVANFVKYRSGHGYVTAPGGSGKSVMIAACADWAALQGLRVVILARNEKLLTQNRAKLANPTIAGIYCAGLGERNLDCPITIASIQSIAGVTLPGKFDLALVDECDEINSVEEGQYWKFFAACGSPRILGFTATPWRTTSGLIAWGDEIISIPIAPLVTQGHLVAPYNKVTCTPEGLSDIPVSLGDYVQSRLSEVYTDPDLLYTSLEKIIQYSADRHSVLIFTQSLAHSDMLAHAMEANGLPAVTVSGETDKEELDWILQDFEQRRFKFLINCQLLTVGVDLPCIDMVVLLRATKSKRLFEQMVYRGTRPYEGKDNFLLLDMGNNLIEHGPLGSPWRGMSTAGKSNLNPQPGKVCPQCEGYAVWGSQDCADCGYTFPITEERKVTHGNSVDGTSNTIYGGAAGAEETIITHLVTAVRYAKHRSRKSNNESLRVDYYCSYGPYGSISEWLSPKHESSEWARDKAWKFFKERGIMLSPPIEDIEWDDLLFEATKLAKPYTITVDHSDKYARVISYGWEPQPLALPAPTAIPAEVDLDDEICF